MDAGAGLKTESYRLIVASGVQKIVESSWAPGTRRVKCLYLLYPVYHNFDGLGDLAPLRHAVLAHFDDPAHPAIPYNTWRAAGALPPTPHLGSVRVSTKPFPPDWDPKCIDEFLRDGVLNPLASLVWMTVPLSHGIFTYAAFRPCDVVNARVCKDAASLATQTFTEKFNVIDLEKRPPEFPNGSFLINVDKNVAKGHSGRGAPRRIVYALTEKARNAIMSFLNDPQETYGLTEGATIAKPNLDDCPYLLPPIVYKRRDSRSAPPESIRAQQWVILLLSFMQAAWVSAEEGNETSIHKYSFSVHGYRAWAAHATEEAIIKAKLSAGDAAEVRDLLAKVHGHSVGTHNKIYVAKGAAAAPAAAAADGDEEGGGEEFTVQTAGAPKWLSTRPRWLHRTDRATRDAYSDPTLAMSKAASKAYVDQFTESEDDISLEELKQFKEKTASFMRRLDSEIEEEEKACTSEGKRKKLTGKFALKHVTSLMTK